MDRRVKTYVEWELQHVADYRRALRQAKADMVPAGVAQYGPRAGSSSGASRTTEDVAVRLASAQYIRHLEETVRAIDKITGRLPDEDHSLIEMVYWRRSHTVTGAGLQVGLSKSAAYQHINAILLAIAQELGYVNAGKNRE